MMNQTRRRFLSTIAATTAGLGTQSVVSGATSQTTSNSSPPAIYEGHAPPRPGEWKTTSFHRCDIFYPSGYTDDVDRVKDILAIARDAVTGRLPIDPDHVIDVYIHPVEERSTIARRIEYSVDTGYQRVAMHIPSPSGMLASPYYTGRDERKRLAARYRYRITRAYAAIVIHRLVVNSRGLSNFYGALPNYLTAGLAPHLAHFHTPPVAADADWGFGLETEIDTVLSHFEHDRTARLNHLGREPAAAAGALVYRWLSDEWGWDAIQDFISTQVLTYERNIRAAFGVSKEEFEREWLQWLNTTYGMQYSITPATTTAMDPPGVGFGNVTTAAQPTDTRNSGSGGGSPLQTPLFAIPALLLAGGTYLLGSDRGGNSGDDGGRDGEGGDDRDDDRDLDTGDATDDNERESDDEGDGAADTDATDH